MRTGPSIYTSPLRCRKQTKLLSNNCNTFYENFVIRKLAQSFPENRPTYLGMSIVLLAENHVQMAFENRFNKDAISAERLRKNDIIPPQITIAIAV